MQHQIKTKYEEISHIGSKMNKKMEQINMTMQVKQKNIIIFLALILRLNQPQVASSVVLANP